MRTSVTRRRPTAGRASTCVLAGTLVAASGLATAPAASAGPLVGAGAERAAASPRVAAPPIPASVPARSAAPAPRLGATSTITGPSACAPAGDPVGSQLQCDLWARPGTLTLPDGANPASVPIWGYSASETGDVSTPGPALVVTAGVPVTLTLHNRLLEPTSLSLPQVDGFLGDGVGAQAGADRTYTFTPGRPGTYLYEAGLTDDGPRQAALGLVGALVVRPAADQTTDSLDGSTATVFDDEAVLVLSELDQRLATNPAGFDMRSFAPRFRLINGGALTTAAGHTLVTGPSHRVLLRVVNAGLTEHSLGALGLRQTVLATGSRTLSRPYDVFAETVAPGDTLDTLVTVPAGAGDAAFPLYETAAGGGVGGNLANFDGMVTLLQSVGDPTTGGPSVSGLALASPNPVPLPAFPVTPGATLTLTGEASADATTVEYAVDDQDAGWTALTGVGAGPFQADLTTAADLTTGLHTVFVRAGILGATVDDPTVYGDPSAVTFAVDADGPRVVGLALSPLTSTGLAVGIAATGDDATTGGSNVVSATYTLDGGAPVPLTLNRTTSPVAALTGTIAAGSSAGPHTVAVTAVDALGNATGTPVSATFVVDQEAPTVTAGSIAVDPAVQDGVTENRTGSGAFAITATLQDNVSVRAGEGFLDNDTTTGAGTGFALYAPSMATGTPLTVSVEVPLSELTAMPDGPHGVRIRARDTAGQWGALTTATGVFVLDRVAPTLGAITVNPTPSRGAQTASVSVPVSNVGTDVGSGVWTLLTSAGVVVGGGTLTGTASGTTGAATPFTGTVAYPAAAGTYTLRVSVVDGTGRVKAKSRTVTVQANRIFVSTFDTTGSPYGWSNRTGTGFVTSTTTPIAGTRSGTVSLGTSNAYVTDNTPAAETTFHAQLQLRANGTTATTGLATVYDAWTGDNGGTTGLFRIRLRHSGGAVQVGIATATGTPATWATVTSTPTGSSTVRVDLVGTTATLTVNGVAAGSVTVPSAAGVGSVRLGSIGTGTAALGSITVDSYDSARDRLPS